MLSSDPVKAHAQGASKACRNAAKKIAEPFNIPATRPGLSPTANLDRVVRAAENKLKDAQELSNMRAKELQDAGKPIRHPRFRDRDE